MVEESKIAYWLQCLAPKREVARLRAPATERPLGIIRWENEISLLGLVFQSHCDMT